LWSIIIIYILYGSILVSVNLVTLRQSQIVLGWVTVFGWANHLSMLTRMWANARACLDQLLIAVRLFTLLCDQSRSQARLIAIMKLIAKLGIIYTTACHASLCTTALDCLSVSCHCRRTALTTIYKHSTGRGGEE